MRKAAIKIDTQLAGWLTLDERGYHFVYGEAAPQNFLWPLSGRIVFYAQKSRSYSRKHLTFLHHSKIKKKVIRFLYS
jgi:hypothetical protein